MPIYAYRCEACGHSKDVLQKVSDARLTTCPQCGAQAFQKQVTAAGFQLKGSGWYVTDFRGSGQKPAGDAKGDAAATSGTPGAEAKGEQSSAGKGDAGAPPTDAKSNKATETPAGKTPSTTPSTTPVAKTADKAPSSAGTGSTPP